MDEAERVLSSQRDALADLPSLLYYDELKKPLLDHINGKRKPPGTKVRNIFFWDGRVRIVN